MVYQEAGGIGLIAARRFSSDKLDVTRGMLIARRGSYIAPPCGVPEGEFQVMREQQGFIQQKL